MADDAPSWLTGSSNPTPSAPPAAPTAFSVEADTNNINAGASMLQSSGLAVDNNPTPKASTVDESDLPRAILIMRLSNMGAVAALITVSVSCLHRFLNKKN